MPATDRPGVTRLIWVVAAVLLVTGLGVASRGLLGHSGPPSPSTSSTAAQTPPAIAPLPRSEPVRVAIPAIGVDAPVVPEGLDTAGQLEAPPLSEHNLAGWFQYGPTPGQLGPAVIEGHVDSKAGPSVFYNLGKLTAGARVDVTRQDGRHAVFQVDTLQQVSKDAFPTQKVYGSLNYSALRLITCGGVFNTATGSYTDNIIVYAHRIPN